MKKESPLTSNQNFKIVGCKIKKSLESEGITILKVNIEYPKICEDTEFSSVFNSFYEKIASNYFTFCEGVLFKKLKKKKCTDELFRPYGEIMKYFITFNNDKYISVVCDISHFNGYKKETRRFSFVWSIENKIVLPLEHFEKEYCVKKHDIRKRICEIIMEQIKNECCEFDYSEKSIRRYAGRVNFSNFFLTNNGLAFWFDEGTLAKRENGFPTFIYAFPD